jgi:N-methylhydantoinase A
LGGKEATLTDAFVALGIVAAGEFAGGRINIDRDLARTAVGTLSSRLDLSIEQTAEAIIRIATSHIYSTLVPLLARKGVDYSDYTLLPFGGAGPMHGLLVARDIGIRKVLVPLHPGVLCATGALVADVRTDFVRTIHRTFSSGDAGDLVDELRSTFEELEKQGAQWLDAQNLTYVSRRFRRVADMRYHGQSFEIAVPLDDVDLSSGADALVRAFQSEYEKVYGYANSGVVFDVRDVRVVSIGETPKPKLERLTVRSNDAPLAKSLTKKEIWHDGKMQPASFVDRAHILPGYMLPGPAVITQYDTTTFVPSGYTVTSDQYGNLIAEANHGN